MIDTETLNGVVSEYLERCREHNITPTYKGVGASLGISGDTIRHIVTGYYKGNRIYTTKPHPTRCVGNDDFLIIKDVFK